MTTYRFFSTQNVQAENAI